MLNKVGDAELAGIEAKQQKYLNRMHEIISGRCQKYADIKPERIYKEIERVIYC